MSIIPLAKGIDQVTHRLKNKRLRTVQLQPTPENRKILKQYEDLAAKINQIPARMDGLRVNYRRRDLAMPMAQLVAERELLMSQLLVLEKIIFAKP